MSEIITNFYLIEKDYDDYDESTYWKTIVIETTKQKITFSIDNLQSCCENFDVRLDKTNRGFDYYIGAELFNVEWCHERIVSTDDLFVHEANFTVSTDKGDFVVSIFNDHNGYYPHEYRVSAPGFNLEDRDCL